MRSCTKCGIEADKFRYSGLTCRSCYQKTYKRINRISLNEKRRNGERLKKDIVNAKRREAYTGKYRQQRQESSKRYYNSLSPEVKKIRARKAALKARYGLTLEGFEQIKASQNNQCAICEKNLNECKTISTDHNHKTGKVRGLLCQECNTGIGMFRENPEIFMSAINYIDSRGRGTQ